MDSAEFLDLLGNNNRRRILQLLARKPCYVTEISEFLGVSPKAVIDHLRKLEDAGLVESRTDERRRKYFSIARHVQLEVTVSPYEFGTKSAYPANSKLDVTSWHRVTLDIDDERLLDDLTPTGTQRSEGRRDGTSPDPPEEINDVAFGGEDQSLIESGDEVVTLVERLQEFEQLERELSLAQRWTQGRMTELREQLTRAIGDGDPRLVSDILLALAGDATRVETLSREVEVPPRIVEEVLEDLATEGIVYRDGRDWHLDS